MDVEVKRWIVGLLFASVVGGIVVPLFLYSVRGMLRLGEKPKKDIKRVYPWLTGAVERLAFAVFVGLELPDATTAMMAWLALKLAANWNRSDLERTSASARTTKRFPWSRWASAIQILRPSESKRGNRPQRWTQLDVRLADYRLGGKTICPFPTRQYVVRLSTPECAALLTSRRSFFLYSSLPGIVFSCHSLNPQHSVAPIIIAIYRLQTF